MANNTIYLARLQVAVAQLNNCVASYSATVPVHEIFRGQTVWQGKVEVFDLHGHAQSKRCYAWSHPDDEKGERIVTVLEIPPVKDAVTAVRASIVADSKK